MGSLLICRRQQSLRTTVIVSRFQLGCIKRVPEGERVTIRFKGLL